MIKQAARITTMISSLEGPYPDEALDSLIARALAWAQPVDRKAVGLTIAGSYGANWRLELPTNLNAIAETVGRPLGLSPGELIAKTTSLPLYAPFISEQRYRAVRAAMLRYEGVSPASLLGLHADRTIPSRQRHFCVRCSNEARQQGRETWWRRTHLTRGVECCPIHGCALSKSQFDRRGTWKVDHPLVDSAVAVKTGPAPDRFARTVAANVQWLLQTELEPLGAERLRTAYFEAARARGLVIGGRINRRDFLHEMAAEQKNPRFGALGLSFDPSSTYAWPAKLLVAAGDCHPPLRHICLLDFLKLDVSTFVLQALSVTAPPRKTRGIDPTSRDLIRMQWSDRSVTMEQIARDVGVNVATVRSWATSIGLSLPRFPSPETKRRFAERCRQTRAEFRSLGSVPSPRRTTCLKWLSRNDRHWLRQQRSKAAGKQILRLDWDERDGLLVTAVKPAVRRIMRMRPFRRLTLTGICEEVRAHGIYARSFGRLPKFTRAVASYIETPHRFALRRNRSKARPQRRSL